MIDLGLKGRVALVTGAGAGIGRSIATWLARAGCAIAVNDIDATRADETVASLRADGATAVALVADVLDDHDVAAMMDSVRAALGSLDIAVNNVGMLGGHHAAALVETSVEGLRAVLERNLLATLRCCRAEAAAMIVAGGGGVIVNVSSGESLRPAPSLAAYGAAKAGINHLTQTLAVELGPHGIRVNAMAPGTTLTEEVRAGLPAEYLEALRASIPLGRMVDADDMGRTAVYLASDLARNVTGQLVLADAGAHLSRNRPQLPRR